MLLVVMAACAASSPQRWCCWLVGAGGHLLLLVLLGYRQAVLGWVAGVAIAALPTCCSRLSCYSHCAAIQWNSCCSIADPLGYLQP